ncbi:Aldose 1-epimerase family protein YeaD [hydrothermal vent metagenome]|uniref:glucose-6-phosphate 1-epimerase n=1 Tax=hydrothermal vent metagenome TaxID=652676 RepID=A0A3B0X524_9ZZZZ
MSNNSGSVKLKAMNQTTLKPEHLSVEQLNKVFALKTADNNLSFKLGEGGIPLVEIYNQYGSALISLQGAHLLSWVPEGEEDVIWLSKEANFSAGKSVRGGVPICWPWFGAHKTNTNYPAHGFARTTNWQVIKTEALDDGGTRISFTTQPQAETIEMWLPDTSVQFQISLGKKLEMELITHNNGVAPVTISQALHTYFKVGDVSKVLLHGLDDTDYLDKLENFKRKVQHGPISIDEEVDRIYLDTVNDCVIEDKSLNRNIVIIKCGSHSTVVWNPWEETANKMGDLGHLGYKQMLCVESSNAADDAVVIQPGKAHQLWVQYEVQGTGS